MESQVRLNSEETTLKKRKGIKIILFVNFNIHVIFEQTIKKERIQNIHKNG